MLYNARVIKLKTNGKDTKSLINITRKYKDKYLG